MSSGSTNAFKTRASMRSGAVLALVAGLAATAVACQKEQIEIIKSENSEGGDFGRASLLAAVEEFGKTPTDAVAYGALAAKIAALRPRFDKESNALADRMLAFLAIEPLAAHSNRPPDEQLEMLASTVWPSALGPAPKKDEGGREYLQRVCDEELASECKFIVPEYWPLFIGAKVWRRFRFRAQETFAYCRACQSERTYRDTLKRFDELAFPIERLAADREGEGHPREWPRAEPTATVWSSDPTTLTTLEVSRSGDLRLSGRDVAGKDWRERLRTLAENSQTAESQAVGLYLRPDVSVARLREYLRELGALGFKSARLQVRLAAYPYELRYYPLSTSKRGGAPLSVRATDTIQVMVLAADQATKRVGGESPLLNAF